MNIKHTVYNYDELLINKGKKLFIVEGPFDALKIDYYGRPERRATCLFSSNMLREQVWLLETLAGQYGKLVVRLDHEAMANELRVVADLGHIGAKLGRMPLGVGDPGELTPELVAKL